MNIERRHGQRQSRVTTDTMTIERIWLRAVRKRIAEKIDAHDANITAAIESQACGVFTHSGVICGAPLDNGGFCGIHDR